MNNALYYSDSNQFTTSQQYAKIQSDASNLQWQSMSISIGSIYAIDTSGQPWYLPNYKQSNWTKLVGGGQFYPAHRMTQT